MSQAHSRGREGAKSPKHVPKTVLLPRTRSQIRSRESNLSHRFGRVRVGSRR